MHKRKGGGGVRILHSLKDERLESWSVLTETTVKDYLNLTRVAFDEQGNLPGQREAQRTTTALRIRERMLNDVVRGAILPPIVIGLVVSGTAFAEAARLTNETLFQLVSELDDSQISIIDGMQRTAVLKECAEKIQDRAIRVELWIVTKTAHLTYRMLILNTGQVPWNLRRQIEVIHASLLSELRARIDTLTRRRFEVFSVDDKRRRFNPGEYQANDLIELYIAFGLRSTKIDKEAVLATQFSQLDMIESAANPEHMSIFSELVASMASLDHVFSKATVEGEDRERGQIVSGRELFDRLPACVGFIVAGAQLILGRPGAGTRSFSEQEAARAAIKERVKRVVERLEALDAGAVRQFLDFETLNGLRSQPAGKIGEFERELFLEAFRLFLKEDVGQMTPCWRALA